jgi:hypothetical protein
LAATGIIKASKDSEKGQVYNVLYSWMNFRNESIAQKVRLNNYDYYWSEYINK